jgi:hypothetical protein
VVLQIQFRGHEATCLINDNKETKEGASSLVSGNEEDQDQEEEEEEEGELVLNRKSKQGKS